MTGGIGKNQKTHQPLPSWAGILLIGGLALAAWLFVVYVPGRRSSTVSFTPSPSSAPEIKAGNNSEGTPQEASSSQVKTPTGEAIPTVVNSYIGTITSLDYQNNKCTVMVKADRNYLKNDTEFTVSVNKETVLEARIIPQVIEAGANGQRQQERINFTDLKVGDEVIVASKANLKDENSFMAQWVVKNMVR